MVQKVGNFIKTNMGVLLLTASLCRILLLLVIVIIPHAAATQQLEKRKQPFEIYLDVGINDEELKDFKARSNLKTLKRFTRGFLTRSNNWTVDYDWLKYNIIEAFPSESDEGFLVIDWEGQAINELKTYAKNPKMYPERIKEYIRIVETVKSVRPNIRVGIYGIPFRMWSDRQLAKNPYDYELLFPLLKKCDFISPSLYHLYANTEVPQNKNIKYFKINTQIALKLGRVLNKPVIPYIGVRYYTKKSKFSWELVSTSTFIQDMKQIISSSDHGKHIRGFVLWNGDRFTYRRNLKNSTSRINMDRKTAFMEEHLSTMKNYISILDSLTYPLSCE